MPDGPARERILTVMTARMRLHGKFDFARLAKVRFFRFLVASFPRCVVALLLRCFVASLLRFRAASTLPPSIILNFWSLSYVIIYFRMCGFFRQRSRVTTTFRKEGRKGRGTHLNMRHFKPNSGRSLHASHICVSTRLSPLSAL